MEMKFLLILFVTSTGFGGSAGIQIPMETMDLCKEAQKTYVESGAHGYNDPERALSKTICIQVKE